MFFQRFAKLVYGEEPKEPAGQVWPSGGIHSFASFLAPHGVCVLTQLHLKII